jgi:uncharacterized membrane protein
MNSQFPPPDDARPAEADAERPEPVPPRSVWARFRDRLVNGMFLVLPFLITCWVFRWLYVFIESNIVGPVTEFVTWKAKTGYFSAEVPYWFEKFAAPAVGIAFLIGSLFLISLFDRTRVHRFFGWLLVHVPVFSWVYNPVRRVFANLETQKGENRGHKRPQRMVLVPFPHTGMKVPAIVTGDCRDQLTGKTVLCCYVPTTPVPTSGYFLLVPEAEVTELNWDTEQTLQAIISGGLTTPPEISYFRAHDLPTRA